MMKIKQLTELFTVNNYNLMIDLTDHQNRQFSGRVIIKGAPKTATKQIILHAKDLTIQQILVQGKICDFHFAENDELVIEGDFLEAKQIIEIDFSGKITDAMHGLYPCYFEENGHKKYLLATQFESHHAREVFPCIDEPAAKATFDVTIKSTQHLTVLGNMPIINQSVDQQKLVTTFATTPIMSSYLLAFVVGELHKKTAVTKRGVEVNVWATPAQEAKVLDFGLDIAVRTIDFFEEYFQIDYPLPKSDHVALPDFSSGAMENWGLITYRESCLLADDEQTPESSKHFIATVIAHELSHQWFGNLVTMQWWNDLWLNESFANMMEYVAIDALEPSWRVWEDFANSEVAAALRRDSIDGVQSVKMDVNHPDEITALFDGAIVYAKGGRLLKMMKELVGEKAFRSGLKDYFQKYAYQNTIGADLWQSIEKYTDFAVSEIMEKWISQAGFPVVSVTQNGQNIEFSQQRFFTSEHQPDQTLWPIPLFPQNDILPKMLDQPKMTATKTDDVLINHNLSAHFIANYDDKLRQKLINNINQNKMSTLDKMCFLQDSSLLARADLLPSSALLPLAMAFENEQNEKLYGMACATLMELYKFVYDDQKLNAKLKLIAQKLALPTFDKLGWKKQDGENYDDNERRLSAVDLLIYAQNEVVLQLAKNDFELGIEQISADMRGLILSANVRNFETPTMIDQLFELYQTTNSNDLKQDLASALTHSKNPATIEKILQKMLDTKIIRPQDTARWFAFMLKNRFARQSTWQWLLKNGDFIEEVFAGDKGYGDFVIYTGKILSTTEHLAEFRQYFQAKKDNMAIKRNIELADAEIVARLKLIEQHQTEVAQAINDFNL